MRTSNKYLVQALRSYRMKSYGQFDQVTEHILPITQDAASEIERLNAEVERLTTRSISLTQHRPITSGDFRGWSWRDIGELLSKEDGSVTFYTLVVDDDGIQAYGSILP